MLHDLFLIVPTGILFDDRVVYFSVAIYTTSLLSHSLTPTSHPQAVPHTLCCSLRFVPARINKVNIIQYKTAHEPHDESPYRHAERAYIALDILPLK